MHFLLMYNVCTVLSGGGVSDIPELRRPKLVVPIDSPGTMQGTSSTKLCEAKLQEMAGGGG